MLSLIKQVFSVLLTFSKSLSCDRIKCVSLNYEPFVVRPTLIELNPVELKYYPSMSSLGKCNVSFSVLSPKKCVPKNRKDKNVKVFNMITNKKEAKTVTKHIFCH